MKSISILLLTTSLVTLIACKKDRISGSGPVITETRAVTNFTRIHVSGSTNVFVTQGAGFKVEINGYANLIPYFETRLVNNTLELGYKNNTTVKNDNIKILVTLPVLNGLTISGSGNIFTSGIFDNNPVFETHIAGSGNINFSQGTAQNFISTIAGSGSVYAFGMQAVHADIIISGSGNQEISAGNNLKVNIAGSGNVYYKGTPVINVHISGSGAVIPR